MVFSRFPFRKFFRRLGVLVVVLLEGYIIGRDRSG